MKKEFADGPILVLGDGEQRVVLTPIPEETVVAPIQAGDEIRVEVRGFYVYARVSRVEKTPEYT